MGQQVREPFIRGCAATLTAWLWWGQCRGFGGGRALRAVEEVIRGEMWWLMSVEERRESPQGHRGG